MPVSDEKKHTKKHKTIQHLVISGGSFGGIVLYGALKQSNLRGEWSIDNIQSIDAISAGSILAVIISLKYDWEIIDNYIIKRPWQNILKFDKINPFKIIGDCGVFDVSVIIEVIAPFLRGVGLSIDVSMREFFEFTGIDLHFYATNLYTDEIVDFNHASFPDLRIVDAVYRSSTIPLFFIPQCEIKDEKEYFYLDGYLIANYPSTQFLQRVGTDKHALGFKYANPHNKHKITNIFDMAKQIIVNLFRKSHTTTIKLKHQYTFYLELFTVYELYCIVNNSDKRRELLLLGEECQSIFCSGGEAAAKNI